MHALPGHLTDAGLTRAAADRIASVADADGLGAVAGLDLGADPGRAMAALSESLLDGLHCAWSSPPY
ncbi:hypothetical protein ACFWIO_05345 [Streptomyces diastatochromogenes]|uniref:hypothetical protein n=1 Tax=Streptomyces diastatochromogenes TaxID=42236 RepID=UPI003657E606